MKKRLLFLTLVAVLLLALLPATAAASSCTPSYYRVQRGDTLARIAGRYGVSMYAIASANRIANLNIVYVGQLLLIPCPGVPAPTCIHIVQRGEWLSTIASRYGVSLWAIASHNGIYNPNWIYPGQRLEIPGCTPTPKPTPTPTPPQPWPPWPSPPPPPSCPIMPVMGFGRVWANNLVVHNKLGCPVATEFSVDGAEQHFQHAIVIWREDQTPVNVLYRNRTWTTLPDPLDSCHCNPALTPYVGWPTSSLWLGKVSVQDFAGGTMLWTSCCGIYVLYDDGTWKHYS